MADDDEAVWRELLQLLRDRDERGARAVVDRLQQEGGPLHRTVAAVARSFGAHEARTKDVVQHVTLKLLTWVPHTTQKSARSQIKAWVRTVARNKLTDDVRKSRKEQLEDERNRSGGSGTAPPLPPPPDPWRDGDYQSCLERAKPPERLLLLLGMEERTALEIAHATGLIDAATLEDFARRPRPPHGQADDRVRIERKVDKRKQRARGKLRRCVERLRLAREYRAALLRQVVAGGT